MPLDETVLLRTLLWHDKQVASETLATGPLPGGETRSVISNTRWYAYTMRDGMPGAT